MPGKAPSLGRSSLMISLTPKARRLRALRCTTSSPKLGPPMSEATVPPTEAEGGLQGDVVEVQHAGEELLRGVVEPAALFFMGGLEKAAAQHGREGDRYHARDEDGHGDGDGELLEQTAQHTAQEEHRNRSEEHTS